MIVTLGAVCAETDAEADRLAASTKVLIRRIRLGGERRPVPTPEVAAEELDRIGPDANPLLWDECDWPRYIVGGVEKVRGILEEMARVLRADELMILTVIHSHAARIRSYELLADACGLAQS